MLNLIDHKNIYRVFTNNLFLRKNNIKTCSVNNGDNIFFVYNQHHSSLGVKMINDLITKEIEKIELSDN